MTIAAGFRFDGGIFLCADSQFNRGRYIKTLGQKVMSGGFTKLSAKLGFAIAGDVTRANSAIRKIVMGIDCLPSTATAHDIYAAIEQAMEESYKPILKHPLYGKDGSPDFWLVMCVWREGQGSVLLATQDDVVTEVQDWTCIGSGDYLFRYILDDVYRKDMELQELVTLVSYAIQEIKEFDPNVGFDSEFIAFFNGHNSFSRIAGYDVGHMENFGSLVKREFFHYMFVMADLRKTEDELKAAKQLFEDNLINLRTRYKADKDNRQSIESIMNTLSSPGSSVTFRLPLKKRSAKPSASQRSTGRR